VGFGIEYTDGGAPARLAEFAKQLKAASISSRTLTVDNKNLAASYVGLADAERGATAGMGGFASASRAGAGSSGASAAAARAQAEAFWIVAAAANAAAAAMARAGTASAGFGLGGSFGAPAAMGRTWQDVGAYAQPAMRSVGYSRLSGETSGGWMSPWAAGMMSGGPGGPGGRVGQRALPGGSGGGGGFESFSAGGGGGGGGGRRPGGGGFGIPMPPLGGPLGWAAGKALHIGLEAAKYGAEAGLGLAWDSIHEAARYQLIMTSVRNVTGASTAQMARARAATFDVGHMSGTSASESAEMFREIARQSQGAMSFDSMLSLLPQAAKMQVVLGATRGFTPTQTVDNTMALVHLFRQYDPKGVPKMMDTVLKMGELMPSNLSQAVTQMGYFLPTLKNLHVPDEDAASLMVAISRFGMGRAKGGTSIANLFNQALGPLQLTQHAQAGKAGLLGPKMLDVIDAKGKSRFFTDKGGDAFGFLDQLANFEKQHGSVMAQKVFTGAFGKTGTRIASVLADPVMVDQLHKIHDAIVKQKSLSLDAQAHSIFGTAWFPMKQAGSDFQSLMTEVGKTALPGVTKGFTDLAGSLHWAQGWLHQHAALEKQVQQTILADVKATEKWIVAHQDDFKQLAKDAKWAFDNLDKVGNALAFVGDAAFKVMHILDGSVTTPATIKGGNGQTYTFNPNTGTYDQDPMGGVTEGQPKLKYPTLGHTPPKPVVPHYNPNTPGTPFYTAPTHSSSQRRVVHEHHHHLHLHGGDTVSRHEVRKKVEEVLSEGSSDPRHHTGKSGTIVTSPRQPTRLTTTVAP
jgi:hypothetical protein